MHRSKCVLNQFCNLFFMKLTLILNKTKHLDNFLAYLEVPYVHEYFPPLFKNEEYAYHSRKVWERNYAYLQVNNPSLSERVGGTSNFMITFNSCFMMSWKQESKTFTKGKAKTRLSVLPQPLILRMPLLLHLHKRSSQKQHRASQIICFCLAIHKNHFFWSKTDHYMIKRIVPYLVVRFNNQLLK